MKRRRFQKGNSHLVPEVVKKIRQGFYERPTELHITVFQGGGDGRGYRNMYKMPGGSKSIQATDTTLKFQVHKIVGVLCFTVDSSNTVAVGSRE